MRVGHAGPPQGVVQHLQGGSSGLGGEGGVSRLGVDAVGGGPVQGGGDRDDALGRSSSAIPEVQEVGFLLPGQDSVLHGVLDPLGPAGGDGLGYLVLSGAGPGCDGAQGAAQGGLVEAVGPGGLGGQLGHLLDAGGVEVAALAVLLPEGAGGLVEVSAGALPMEGLLSYSLMWVDEINSLMSDWL